MGVSTLKSTAITNLDATVLTPNTSGEGGPGIVRQLDGYITTVAADAATTTYRLVRLPSNAKVKAVHFTSAAQGAGKVQLSAYYSDSTTDGTAVANQGLIVPTNGAAFFSDDIDCTSAVLRSDKTFANQAAAGKYAPLNSQKSLWDALGVATDPGGFIDIVAVVHTTDITTGAAALGVSCEYVI